MLGYFVTHTHTHTPYFYDLKKPGHLASSTEFCEAPGQSSLKARVCFGEADTNFMSKQVEKGSFRVWGTSLFLNYGSFYGEELLAPRPNPQAGGPPLVGCPRLLIQYIRNNHPYWRPFLHPQPQDAPFRGDRDPFWEDNIKMDLQEVVCGGHRLDRSGSR